VAYTKGVSHRNHLLPINRLHVSLHRANHFAWNKFQNE
jgi:hypothetical protein